MSRSELSRMILLAERLIAAGDPGVLATLFSSSGSTYRPLGSMMVSGFPPIFAGGISGGCLEKYVARVGRSLTQQQPAALLHFDTDPDGEAALDGVPALGCGGTIEVLVERLTREHIAFLRQLEAARSADSCAFAACVIETPDCANRVTNDVSAVNRIWLDGLQTNGHGDAQLERLRQRSLAEQRSRHGVLDALGSRRALVHYIPPITRLVILGAGDDARPLCGLARSLDWHVTVVDRRARLATQVRFAEANEVIADEWGVALSKITFTPRTAVVMMTHSLQDDIDILPLLIGKPMAYVGVLGPAHRREWLLEAVAERIDLPDVFARGLRGPIGLNLGERSATGIAVSIISEILALLNARDAQPLSSRSQPLTQPTAAPAIHA